MYFTLQRDPVQKALLLVTILTAVATFSYFTQSHRDTSGAGNKRCISRSRYIYIQSMDVVQEEAQDDCSPRRRNLRPNCRQQGQMIRCWPGWGWIEIELNTRQILTPR